jgi:hypothetical protein
MALLHSDKELFNKIEQIVFSANNFVLFVPYIKKSILLKLLANISFSEDNAIITTWKPQDIALGSSDIEIYPLCKQKRITLLINNRIHLKSFVINDFKSSVVTSSNISARGFALSQNYNYELGTFIPDLSIEDKIYYDKIIEESEEVTQAYYDQVKEQSRTLELKKGMPEEFNIKKDISDREFLLTALPMTDDVETLTDIYNGNRAYEDDILRSAEHDLRLYNISRGYSEIDFKKILKKKFFNHKFIKNLIEFVGEGKYFGEASSWLHDNCTNVPTPRRFEVKEALQRIYNFIVSLSDGRYIVEVPKSHSKYLRKL